MEIKIFQKADAAVLAGIVKQQLFTDRTNPYKRANKELYIEEFDAEKVLRLAEKADIFVAWEGTSIIGFGAVLFPHITGKNETSLVQFVSAKGKGRGCTQALLEKLEALEAVKSAKQLTIPSSRDGSTLLLRVSERVNQKERVG